MFRQIPRASPGAMLCETVAKMAHVRLPVSSRSLSVLSAAFVADGYEKTHKAEVAAFRSSFADTRRLLNIGGRAVYAPGAEAASLRAVLWDYVDMLVVRRPSLQCHVLSLDRSARCLRPSSGGRGLTAVGVLRRGDRRWLRPRATSSHTQ